MLSPKEPQHKLTGLLPLNLALAFFALHTQPNYGEVWAALTILDSFAQRIRLLMGTQQPLTSYHQRRRCFRMKINLLDRNTGVRTFRNASTGAPTANAHKNPNQTINVQDFNSELFIGKKTHPISISLLRVCTSFFPYPSLDLCNS